MANVCCNIIDYQFLTFFFGDVLSTCFIKKIGLFGWYENTLFMLKTLFPAEMS